MKVFHRVETDQTSSHRGLTHPCPVSLLQAGATVRSIVVAGGSPRALLLAGVTPQLLADAGVLAKTVVDSGAKLGTFTLPPGTQCRTKEHVMGVGSYDEINAPTLIIEGGGPEHYSISCVQYDVRRLVPCEVSMKEMMKAGLYLV
jgi:hypothetical protein